MSKNILIISSSPRKDGNSDTLCNEFLRGATEAGHTAEKIFLKDKNIEYCRACGYCYSNKTCIINDDMKDLLNKLKNADVIVLASPLYFYSIPAQMKVFIDRLCSGYATIKNKEFYYIFTAADTEPDSVQYALGEYKGFLSCLENPVEKGYLFARGVWQKGEINNTSYPQKAYEMGKSC